MTLLTEQEAREKLCPLLDISAALHRSAGAIVEMPTATRCIASECMAWRVLHNEIRREDHSGARDVMNTEALRSGRQVRREGPIGCLGILILDAAGYCGAFGEPR